MLEEELDDTHLCIKCSSTIVGLDNYVQHRKNNCTGKSNNPISRDIVHVDHPYGTFDFTEASNFHKTEEVEKTAKSLSDSYDLPYDLGADVFFSSLELQSSSKRSIPTTSTATTTVTRNIPTRATTKKSTAAEDEWIGSSSHSDSLMKAVRDISGSKKCDPVFKLLSFQQDSPEPTEDEEDDEDVYGAPPTSHTGGKWKPDNAPVLRHTLLRNSPAWDDRHHWDMADSHEDKLKPQHETEEFDHHDLNPPPGHTKGKWVPGTKVVKLDYKEEVEVEKIFSDQYWCNTCNRKLSSKVLYERHLKSNLHLKRSEPEIELELASRPLKIEKISDRMRKPSKYLDKQMYLSGTDEIEVAESKEDKKIILLASKKRKRRKYFTKCETCNTRLPQHLLGKHLISHYHYRRMAQNPVKSFQMVLQNMERIVRQSPFQCQPCRFYTNTEQDFTTHWYSRSHCDITDGQGVFWCSFCKFECEDNNQMRRHLSGPEHKEVVLAINRSVPIIIGKKTIIECVKCHQKFRYNLELKKHAKDCTLKPVGTASDEYQSKFTCEICQEICKSRLSLQKHTRFKHQRQQFFCTACKIDFESSEDAKRHRATTEHKITSATCRKSKSLLKKCKICGEILKNIIALKAHLRAKHPNERHLCPLCGHSFVLPQEVGRHVRDKICQPSTSKDFFMLPSTAETSKQLPGNQDNFISAKFSQLEAPAATTASSSSSPPSPTTTSSQTSAPNPAQTSTAPSEVSNLTPMSSTAPLFLPLTPAVCETMIDPPTSESAAESQVIATPSINPHSKSSPIKSEEDCVFRQINAVPAASDANTKSWSCLKCDFSTTLESNFLYHEILHTVVAQGNDTKLPCSVCGKMFRKPALRCHLRKHTNDRLFGCTRCPMRFIWKHNLKSHIENVHGILDMATSKPSDDLVEIPKFQCDTCGKVFYKNYSLKQHVNTHKERDKKFSCPVDSCIYVGRDAADLKDHSVVHSAEMNFACEVDGCNYKGKAIVYLKRHMKTHNPNRKQYSCPQEFCSFTTGNAGHVKRHMMIHSGEKPYKCPHCDYASNISENLRKHVLTTSLHPGKYLYECILCGDQQFKSNFQKDYRAHLVLVHRVESEIL